MVSIENIFMIMFLIFHIPKNMSTCKTGKINYSIHVYITKQNQSTRSCLRKFGKFTIPLFSSASTLYGNVEKYMLH